MPHAELARKASNISSAVLDQQQQQPQCNHGAQQRKAEQQEAAAGQQVQRDGARPKHALRGVLRTQREEREAEDELDD